VTTEERICERDEF